MDENTYGIRKIGPQRYREDPGRYFEDFQVGDVYEHWPGRTVSEADNIWFTNLTMNTHPIHFDANYASCLLYTSPSPRDGLLSRMPSSA